MPNLGIYLAVITSPFTPNSIADLGENAALALPAMAVFIVLLPSQRSLALAWGLSLAICVGVIAWAKLSHFPVPTISGHAGISVAFYLGLAVLAVRLALRPAGIAADLLLSGIVGAVCWSVWILGWHSGSEIIAGASVGLVCPIALMSVATGRESGTHEGIAILVAIGFLIPVLHGVRINYIAAGRLALAAIDRNVAKADREEGGVWKFQLA